MEIYKGPYLTISSENKNNRFVQKWDSSPPSIEVFKKEMLAYISFYKKLCPSQTLWLQKSFSLDIDFNTKLWIERHINQPGKRFGNKKIAFVVSEDVLSHSTVIETFEENQSCLTPRHFATEKEARQWLNYSHIAANNISKPKILFSGEENDGSSVFSLKIPSSSIKDVIKSLKKIHQENEFVNTNTAKYSLLTKREKQILILYSKGLKHKEIADMLCISLLTVRTHWKNTKRKLQIKSFSEIIQYTKAFVQS